MASIMYRPQCVNQSSSFTESIAPIINAIASTQEQQTLHNRSKILKIRDIFELSLLTFAYRNLKYDCPPSLKKYFDKGNITRDTSQRGQLEYWRARIDLRTSWAQYPVAELWNNLSQAKQSVCSKINLENNWLMNLFTTYQN